jgi:hypothetical protein
LRQKKALKTQNINNPLLKKIHAKLLLNSIVWLKKALKIHKITKASKIKVIFYIFFFSILGAF